MLKIATHNSATGEKSANLLSCLIVPFTRTQSKTIKEQYEAGCRSFDIRIKPYKGEFHCAHGLWISKRTAKSILDEINSFKDKCDVCVTYEGVCKNRNEFLDFINTFDVYKNITFGDICIKFAEGERIKASYERIRPAQIGYRGGIQGFLSLNGSSWHTYLPLPWLWDRLYSRPHIFDENNFIYVDFL